MTPADWAASADPLAMVRHLRGRPGTAPSRWFRRVAGLPAPLPERKLLQLLDAVCDLPPADAGEEQRFLLATVRGTLGDAGALALLARGVNAVTGQAVLVPEQLALFLLIGQRHNPPLAAAVRCLFADPADPVGDPRPWRTATAIHIATAAVADGDPGRLPVLADALEEAGCEHAGLLAHLRGGGPHRPGCFALEAVLGATASQAGRGA